MKGSLFSRLRDFVTGRKICRGKVCRFIVGCSTCNIIRDDGKEPSGSGGGHLMN